MLKLAEVQAINRAQLFQNHLEPMLGLMEESSKSWTQHSEERFVFDTLLIEAGEIKLMQTVFIFYFKCFYRFLLLRSLVFSYEWHRMGDGFAHNVWRQGMQLIFRRGSGNSLGQSNEDSSGELRSIKGR